MARGDPTTLSRYPSAARRIFGWSVALPMAIAALVGVAYLSGRDAPTTIGDVPDAIVTSLSRPAVAATVAVLALIAIALCVHHLWLAWLTYKPGRIEVAQLEAPEELKSADLAHLTMQFRQRMARLRLQSPAAVPGATPEGDFLHLLSSQGVEATNLIGSLVSLLQAARPSRAYVIYGVLARRPNPPAFGLTVQVLKEPREAGTPVTFWEASWDDAIRRAADFATAEILPRTRLCQGPWAAWRGYRMPPSLLEAYERAASLEQGRRYDEALGAYYTALGVDPLNAVVRLQIGQLQEKLGLGLEALNTYAGIGESRRVSQRGRYLRLARADRTRTLILAQYRRAVLMGGRQLAVEWRQRRPANGASATERDKRRWMLRTQLVPELAGRAHQLGYSNEEIPALLEMPSDGDRRVSEERIPWALHELFLRIAVQELEQLFKGLRRRRIGQLRTQSYLTPQTVRLTQIRTQVALRHVRQMLDKSGAAAWPPSAYELENEIRPWRRFRGRPRFRHWDEYYSAACIFARPLLDEPVLLNEPVRGAGWSSELAHSAVQCLARAAEYANSGYVASRRDWVLSDDPDLDGLRASPEFQRFEATFFPTARRVAASVPHGRQLELAQYPHDLLLAVAQRCSALWHARAEALRDAPNEQEVGQWLVEETRAWRLVADVTYNHDDWQSRIALMAEIQDWCHRYDLPSLVVAYRRYDDGGALPRLEDTERGARGRIAAGYRRLALMSDVLCHGRTSFERDLSRLVATSAQSDDGSRLTQASASRLCLHQATTWLRLEVWLLAEFDREEFLAKALRLRLRPIKPYSAGTGPKRLSSYRRPPLMPAAPCANRGNGPRSRSPLGSGHHGRNAVHGRHGSSETSQIGRSSRGRRDRGLRL